jgi:hypothetical protein
VTGLSGPIDVAFGPDGTLYLLELAVDYAPATGGLSRIAASGAVEVLVDNLDYPTSLAVDDAGRAYVSQMAAVAAGTPGTGALVRFEPAGP